MAFYKKAAKGRSAGSHPWTAEDMKRIEWCMNKGISIAVIPNWKETHDEWMVEITIGNKTHLDPSSYKGYDAQTKMYEYYKYYYDKNISQR